MIRPDFTRICRRGLSIVLAGFACTVTHASTSKPVITLEPPAGQELSAQALSTHGGLKAQAPANFRDLGDATLGQAANIETLTLRFSSETKLLNISSTPDFVVEQGSSCVEGNIYSANNTCRLLVRFTPQGPGRRLGKLTIAHSASEIPLAVGLGGYGYAPVVSFTPSEISTVPASISGGVGLLAGASSLAVSAGDTLYVADTKNNAIRFMNSSGVFTRLVTGFTISDPTGIVVDAFGDVIFSQNSPAAIQVLRVGNSSTYYTPGSNTCAVGATCQFFNSDWSNPGALALDGSGNIFMSTYDSAAELLISSGLFNLSYIPLDDGYNYRYAAPTAPQPIAVDPYDSIYAFLQEPALPGYPSECLISAETYSSALSEGSGFRLIAGGRSCGFSGDGGEASNAEIGTQVGQMTFDIAGNLYFTDSSNNRVRRIDTATGIIHTIAGDGSVGNAGDGAQATSATLNTPTGLAVDSQGQVYIINYSATSGPHQVIRKMGTNGYRVYGSVLKGSTLLKTSTIMNSGNSALSITRAVFTGANPGDFTIDANSTNCDFSAGNSLASGQSCTVGVNFKPAAAGTRSANLVLLDNTVTGSNIINLTGTGTLPSPAVKITAPTAGATFTSGTTVKFTATVTSTGTAPTGNVTFKVDGASFGSAVALSSGAASVNLTGLTVKTHTISATYNGDGNYAATTASESITVKAASKIVVNPIARPFIPAQAVERKLSAGNALPLPVSSTGIPSTEDRQGCDAKPEEQRSPTSGEASKSDSSHAGDCTTINRADSAPSPRSEPN